MSTRSTFGWAARSKHIQHVGRMPYMVVQPCMRTVSSTDLTKNLISRTQRGCEIEFQNISKQSGQLVSVVEDSLF